MDGREKAQKAQKGVCFLRFLRFFAAISFPFRELRAARVDEKEFRRLQEEVCSARAPNTARGGACALPGTVRAQCVTHGWQAGSG
jgi:hypothetical protein